MGNKYVIVLTACINPGKMIHTSLTDVDIRRRQYEDALEFYLLQTDYPIVFVENSGTDISGDFRKFVDCGRLEFVTFQGNEEFDRKKGKGYDEDINHRNRKRKLVHTIGFTRGIYGYDPSGCATWLRWNRTASDGFRRS